MFYLCVMSMLEESIVSLLLRHNCVVVPSFGGFVAQSSGAKIDRVSGWITPPRKSILFNKQLINNDGLLIAHISKESAMDYREAEEFLTNQVTRWQNQLKEGQRVSINNIGHLYLDAERNISFEQDRYFNLLLQSYGLNKVRFIAEEDVKRTETLISRSEIVFDSAPLPLALPDEKKQETEKEDAKIVPLTPQSSNRKLWKYVAAAALVPFAFYTYWIPVKTSVLESGMISFKDFNPSYKAGEGIYQQKNFALNFTAEENQDKFFQQIAEEAPNDQKAFLYKYDDELSILVRKDAAIVKHESTPKKTSSESIATHVEQVDVAEIIQEVPKAASGHKQMHYITGCFSSRENAEAMVKIMRERGLKSRILDENKGMYRVSAGGADNQNDFDQIVDKAQSIGYKGWKLD